LAHKLHTVLKVGRGWVTGDVLLGQRYKYISWFCWKGEGGQSLKIVCGWLESE
jgi:hypothetical protein